MKKNLLLSLLVLFVAYATQAQYFTLKIAGGYAGAGFLKSEGVIGPKIDPFHPDVDALTPMANITDTMNGKAATYKAIRGSYGQGWNMTLGLGYMINRYIGVDLGVSYLKSATISCDQTRQLTLYTGLNYAAIPYYLTAHITTNAFGISLMPSINIQGAKPGWKVYPYARVGISLPVYGGLTDKVKIDVQDNPLQSKIDTAPFFLGKHTDVTLKTKGTVSIGINGAVGVKYDALPFLSIFAEVNGQYLTTRAKSAEITQWDEDGKSMIAARGVYRTKFNFVDALDGNSNNADYKKPDLNKPKDDIRPTGPFSNLGFNVGITFNLGKETLKKKEKKTEAK